MNKRPPYEVTENKNWWKLNGDICYEKFHHASGHYLTLLQYCILPKLILFYDRKTAYFFGNVWKKAKKKFGKFEICFF
jgi:hypothetical protein